MVPGDILLIRFTKQPQHLGIYTGENIIHADSDAGKCCEHILNRRWSSRVVRIYRVKGLV
jgi:cell wall-associated NlpC family hydrolase